MNLLRGLVLGVIGLGVCAAQTFQPFPLQPPTTITAAPLPAGVQLPGTFMGAVASANASYHPQPTGGYVFGTLVNKSAQLYSYTETDWTLTHTNQLQSSVRTGGALGLRSFSSPNWLVMLFLDGTAGAATTGSATGSAFSGGGFLTIYKKGWFLIPVFGAHVLHTATGGNQGVMIQVGFLHVTK